MLRSSALSLDVQDAFGTRMFWIAGLSDFEVYSSIGPRVLGFSIWGIKVHIGLRAGLLVLRLSGFVGEELSGLRFRA